MDASWPVRILLQASMAKCGAPPQKSQEGDFVSANKSVMRNGCSLSMLINCNSYTPVTPFSGLCSLLDELGKKERRRREESVLNNSGRLERQLEGMQNEGTGTAPQREAGTEGGPGDGAGRQ